MATQSVKVGNVSLGASEKDLKEFFSFSGEIAYVEMNGDNEKTQVAYITFKDSKGAETAVLLSGATIVDQSVTIELAPDYKPPASATLATENKGSANAESAVQKAEDVVSDMLARGFILGKDALNKAKTFDEKHGLTSTATATVASLDEKIGFTEKINVGTTIMNEKVREMDQKYQVSEKTKSALTAAEQTVSNASSALMKNQYVLTGATWAMGAFNKVAKAAGDVGQKTREKVLAEEQAKNPEGNAQVNEAESVKAAEPAEGGKQPSNPPSTQDKVVGEQQAQKPEGNAEIKEAESIKVTLL
ncbi:hypothetical protein ES319_D13G104000v1 [Gossypium barbadense]|uniref:RRM domain-containing protein n=2 Tax=Gossypium barbadense TaxID=3634 RepID=A0A5J5NP42_GOSBA|nr:hypothetical protein ES319_D13G104000v1 [Gossypium barbadense]